MEIVDIICLINRIKKSRVFIYGAGFVAERFYTAIERKGLANRVIAFITSQNEHAYFCGKSVISLDKLGGGKMSDKDLICIAVHEVSYKQIEEGLISKGIRNFVWVYPFLHELYLGEVIKENAVFPTLYLLKKYLSDYAIPIRYLAIEQFYKKNTVGYDIYLKGLGLQCNPQTAKERLNRFIKLIQDWKDYGYDYNSRLKVTTSGDIIDGAHRLALAFYLNIEELYCDVYAENRYNEFIDESTRISNNKLNCFTASEINHLERVKEYMKSVIGENLGYED